jgi:hypothetical protein
MTENPDARELTEWGRRLAQALQILDLDIDPRELLEISERSARAVTGSAGPITTFYVGYAAALAAQTGSTSPNEAVASAASIAAQVADAGAEGGPAGRGWTDTAQ